MKPSYDRWPTEWEPKAVVGGWRFDCERCHWIGAVFEDRQLARHDAVTHVRGSMHKKGHSAYRPEQMTLDG